MPSGQNLGRKMAPRTTRWPTASSSGLETVKQTIVETLEAPRLSGIDTSDCVKFKELRDIYERRVEETRAEQGSTLPATTYLSSIEEAVLHMFIVARGVPVNSIEEISEAHVKDCIEQEAIIQPGDYDLAQSDRAVQEKKLEEGKKLEMQI